MRHLPQLLLLGIIAGWAPPPAAADLPAGYFSETLPNGLRVSILADERMTVVSTQLWYHVGSADEQPGERGLAHLFEHLMFGGTETYEREHYERLHHVNGGYENAYTSPDETIYVSELPPGPHLEAIVIEADRMRGLVVDQQNLDNEKKIVTEELRLRTENDPYMRVLVAAQQAVLGEHPYAFDPGGNKENVAAATVESCRRFYDAQYRPDRAHLIVVGPVDVAALTEQIRESFGTIPAGAVPRQEIPPLHGWEFPSEVSLREDLPPVETAVVGFPLPPAEHPDYWALQVLGQLLGGGAVDPLHERLVRRQKKAVEAGIQRLEFRRGGAFLFYSASLPYRRKTTAFRLLDRSLAEFAELEWLSDATLASAKRTLRRREMRSVYYPSSMANRIGTAQWWLGDETLAFERAVRIEAVTTDDVARVYRQYVAEATAIRLYVKPERVPPWIVMFGWLYPLVAG